MVNISQLSTLFDIDKNICSVYYINKQECTGVRYMKEKEYYREQIVEMIQKNENVKYLAFIYDLMLSFKKKWGI